MTTTPITAGPNDVTVRALFEQWYLRVVKGHPNNLTRDENGGYKFLATLYLAFEASMVIEREACKEACRKIAAQYPTDIWPEDGETLDCKSARMARLTAANCEREIDMRSNA